MAAWTSESYWLRMREALHDETCGVVDLLRSLRDPRAVALGEWNVADVATHLSQVCDGLLGLLRGGLSSRRGLLPGVTPTGDSLIRDIWELGDVTTAAVRAEPERDPTVLADRIEACAMEFLRECPEFSAEQQRPWLVEGTTVSVPTLTGHMLSEMIMHGYDIARADGRRWHIPAPHASMVLAGFLVPAIGELDPHAVVDQQKAAGLQTTYELRIRGGDRFYFLFDDGTLHIEPLSSRRVDCRISADPVAFLTLMWGRESQWKALLKGQFAAWGRRPWLAPQLRSLVRNP